MNIQPSYSSPFESTYMQPSTSVVKQELPKSDWWDSVDTIVSFVFSIFDWVADAFESINTTQSIPDAPDITNSNNKENYLSEMDLSKEDRAANKKFLDAFFGTTTTPNTDDRNLYLNDIVG